MITKYGTVVIKPNPDTGEITEKSIKIRDFHIDMTGYTGNMNAGDMVIEWLKEELNEFNYDI